MSTPLVKEQSTRRRLLARLLVAAAIGAIAIAAFGGVFFLAPRGQHNQSLRAVIVDQLALTDPNPAFVEDARGQLIGAGYTVDYVPRDEVTVAFYSDLAERGYDLVVLRSHIADRSYSVDQANRTVVVEDHARLFTNEIYDGKKYVNDQLASRLTIGSYPEADPTTRVRYFAVDPAFIASRMKGHFHGTTVVLMGCSGLRNDELANAFMAKGAAVVIGWDHAVTASHTDAATQSLLTHLLVAHQEPHLAVAETTQEFGPDPAYGGRLTLYP